MKKTWIVLGVVFFAVILLAVDREEAGPLSHSIQVFSQTAEKIARQATGAEAAGRRNAAAETRETQTANPDLSFIRRG